MSDYQTPPQKIFDDGRLKGVPERLDKLQRQLEELNQSESDESKIDTN